MKSVLEDILKKNSEPDCSTSADDVQGIRYLLRNKHLANEKISKQKRLMLATRFQKNGGNRMVIVVKTLVKARVFTEGFNLVSNNWQVV